MPLIFINGISASGKSTIQKELSKLGYQAYDADDPAFGAAHNKKTNQTVKMLPQNQRTKEWFKAHEWRILREPVKELKEANKEDLAFLCGSAANENEVWDLFDLVICLDINESTLRQRIATRTDNDYGKNVHELDNILEWHKNYSQQNKKFGAKVIDANQPLDQVIKLILELANNTI